MEKPRQAILVRLLLVRIPQALLPSKCPLMADVVPACKAAHLQHSLHGMSAAPWLGGARCQADAEDQPLMLAALRYVHSRGVTSAPVARAACLSHHLGHQPAQR